MKKRDIKTIVGKEIKITNKSLMMIFLLEDCNFSCPHCVLEDEPMYPGYKFSFEQLKMCLSDCHKLQSIQWVHFSGGEPTLWTDGKRNLTDLLIEISKADFEPGFTTNGSYFVNYNKCYDLFQKYLNGANKPLHLYLSIDTFHNNFDVKKGRAKSLDNVIKCKNNMPPEKAKLLNIILVAVISKDSKSLLPDEMIEHYELFGVKFVFVPLQLKGKAKSFAHLCPDLSSDKPEDLGAYYRFHPKEIQKKTNETSNIVLIDNDYYLPDPWRKVARLGHLPEKVIKAYLEENEDMKD